MFIPTYCLNQALSLMVAYSLIVQAFALDAPSMIMRKRPVPFASEPTAPVLAQRQGYGPDGNSLSPITASPTKYNNLGCWSDTTTRILPGSGIVTSDMDVEYCQNFCSQNSYTIFGVEAKDHCYCGNSLANNPSSASLDDCSVTCAGNQQEICGADWRINIYSLAPTTASVTGYSNLGCWSDTTIRILPGSGIATSDMNVEYCQNFCSQNSYTIFGVEAEDHCYCGNYLVNELASASSDDCSVTCVGNPQEICGANWRINIYSSTNALTSLTASPSRTSSGGGSSTSNNINLGIGLGIGLPSLLISIYGCLRFHPVRRFWRRVEIVMA